MNKEQFGEAIEKLLSENDVNVGDAISVLAAHMVMLAIVLQKQTEDAGSWSARTKRFWRTQLRKRLHDYLDRVLDDAMRVLHELPEGD